MKTSEVKVTVRHPEIGDRFYTTTVNGHKVFGEFDSVYMSMGSWYFGLSFNGGKDSIERSCPLSFLSFDSTENCWRKNDSSVGGRYVTTIRVLPEVEAENNKKGFPCKKCSRIYCKSHCVNCGWTFGWESQQWCEPCKGNLCGMCQYGKHDVSCRKGDSDDT